MTVYLVPGRVHEVAPFTMPGEHKWTAEIRQTEFADIQHGEMRVFLGIWTEVPCVDFVFADLKAV